MAGVGCRSPLSAIKIVWRLTPLRRASSRCETFRSTLISLRRLARVRIAADALATLGPGFIWLSMEPIPPVARSPETYARVAVVTGLADDPRRALTEARDGPAFFAALDAHERQDTWSAEEHGAFWSAALSWWPLEAARPPHRDALSISAALLAAEDLDPAAALHVSADTLREREHAGRERASVRRGEELLEHDGYGVAMRRSVGELWDASEARPRLYVDGEDTPDPGYFNPLIRLARGAHRVTPAARRYGELAADARRAAWRAT